MDMSVDMGMDMMYGETMETTEMVEVKDPLMSNWFFVGGLSVAALALGVAAGLLLAKRKIKKGIEIIGWILNSQFNP